MGYEGDIPQSTLSTTLAWNVTNLIKGLEDYLHMVRYTEARGFGTGDGIFLGRVAAETLVAQALVRRIEEQTPDVSKREYTRALSKLDDIPKFGSSNRANELAVQFWSQQLNDCLKQVNAHRLLIAQTTNPSIDITAIVAEHYNVPHPQIGTEGLMSQLQAFTKASLSTKSVKAMQNAVNRTRSRSAARCNPPRA